MGGIPGGIGGACGDADEYTDLLARMRAQLCTLLLPAIIASAPAASSRTKRSVAGRTTRR